MLEFVGSTPTIGSYGVDGVEAMSRRPKKKRKCDSKAHTKGTRGLVNFELPSGIGVIPWKILNPGSSPDSIGAVVLQLAELYTHMKDLWMVMSWLEAHRDKYDRYSHSSVPEQISTAGQYMGLWQRLIASLDSQASETLENIKEMHTIIEGSGLVDKLSLDLQGKWRTYRDMACASEKKHIPDHEKWTAKSLMFMVRNFIGSHKGRKKLMEGFCTWFHAPNTGPRHHNAQAVYTVGYDKEGNLDHFKTRFHFADTCTSGLFAKDAEQLTKFLEISEKTCLGLMDLLSGLVLVYLEGLGGTPYPSSH